MSETTIPSKQTEALLLDRKLEAYGKNQDFAAPSELTVTITLSEYRDLVSSNAKSSSVIDELRSQKWKLEAENKKWKDTQEALKTVCPMNSTQQETESDDN